jgi:hypothetical protein
MKVELKVRYNLADIRDGATSLGFELEQDELVYISSRLTEVIKYAQSQAIEALDSGLHGILVNQFAHRRVQEEV